MDDSVSGNLELAAAIGQRLRNVRRARGWSQQALAAGLFSKGYVSSIEHGKIFPSVRALRRLAERLGVDMSEFFDPALLGRAESPAGAAPAEEARHNSLLLLEARALAAVDPVGVAARLHLLAPEALDPAEQVERYCVLAATHLASGDAKAALGALEDALGVLAGIPTPRGDLVLQVHLWIGETLLARGQAALAADHFARLRQGIQDDPLHDSALQLAALLGQARALAAQGDAALARAAFSEALALAQNSATLDRRITGLVALCRQASQARQWERAAAYGRDAVLLGETYRLFQAAMQTYLQFGVFLPAHDPAARDLVRAAGAAAGRLGAPAPLVEAETALALLELDAGDLPAASRALERAAAAAGPTPEGRTAARLHLARALLDRATGDLPAAERTLRGVIDRLTGGPERALLAAACFRLAQVLVAQDRPTEAAPYYEQAFQVRTGT